MYSECAQTSGQAEPVGLPRKSSSAGISAESQTCSGSRRLCPEVEFSMTVSKSFGFVTMSGGQGVMGALSREQRPRAADAGPVKG